MSDSVEAKTELNAAEEPSNDPVASAPKVEPTNPLQKLPVRRYDPYAMASISCNMIISDSMCCDTSSAQISG